MGNALCGRKKEGKLEGGDRKREVRGKGAKDRKRPPKLHKDWWKRNSRRAKFTEHSNGKLEPRQKTPEKKNGPFRSAEGRLRRHQESVEKRFVGKGGDGKK